MKVCVKYEFRENSLGYYDVRVFNDGKLIRRYEADNVSLNNKLIPPTKTLCVEAHTIEYDTRTKWLSIDDIEGVVR
jgi:hypothetical protein